jgi:hypothetical protein
LAQYYFNCTNLFGFGYVDEVGVWLVDFCY